MAFTFTCCDIWSQVPSPKILLQLKFTIPQFKTLFNVYITAGCIFANSTIMSTLISNFNYNVCVIEEINVVIFGPYRD